MKERLEIFLGDDLSASWRFVGMVYFEEDLEPDGRAVCSSCEPFTMKGDKEVSPKLAAVEADLTKQCPSPSPSHEEYKKIVRTLLFLISAKPTPTQCLLQKEVFSKIVGEKGLRGKKDKIGQGSLPSVMFWTPAQTEIMFNPELQFVVFFGPWSVGKTLCMREKARQLALENPRSNVNFCILKPDIANDTLLYLEAKSFMADLPNVIVTSMSTTENNLMSDITLKVKTSIGDWFFDEVILPGEHEHKNFAGKLTELIRDMKNQERRLWMTVAGMGHPVNLDPSYMKDFLFALKGRKGKGKQVAEFHFPDLEVPLRSCLSVLEEAGLRSGSSKTVGVTSGYGGKTNVSYKIPPNLIEGTPCVQLHIQSEEERVEKVTKAREMMRQRLGSRGAPILLTNAIDFSTKESAMKLKNLLQGLNGTSQPLCHLSHPPIKNTEHRELVEDLGDIVDNGEAGVKVVDWLKRREAGEEERDLVVDLEVARGWEVDVALVVVGKESKNWENAVMRVVSFVVVLRNF